MKLSTTAEIVEAVYTEKVMDLMEHETARVKVAKINAAGYEYFGYFGGTPEVTFGPEGKTLTIIEPSGERHEVVSPKNNNFVAHNVIEIELS